MANSCARAAPEFLAAYQHANAPTRDRVDEIFAVLMTRMMVFGAGEQETESFLCYHLISTLKMLRLPPTSDSKHAIGDVLLRLFMAADAIPPDCKSRVEWLHDPWRRVKTPIDEIGEAFDLMLDKVSSLLPEHDTLWSDPDSPGRTYCRQLLREVYPSLRPFMRHLWFQAICVFRSYVGTYPATADTTPADMQMTICDTVKTAMEEGRPLIRCRYVPPGDHPPQETDERAFDAFALASAVLRAHLGRDRDALGREVHLYRNPDNGAIDYPARSLAWYDFQLDPGRAALFCPVPWLRRDRFQREIAILKTFWDIASNLRARRLGEILSDVFNDTA